MVIFHSYVSLPEGSYWKLPICRKKAAYAAYAIHGDFL